MLTSAVTSSPGPKPCAKPFRHSEPPLCQPSSLLPEPANQTSCGRCGAVVTTIDQLGPSGSWPAAGVRTDASRTATMARATTIRRHSNMRILMGDSFRGSPGGRSARCGLRYNEGGSLGAQTWRRASLWPVRKPLASVVSPAFFLAYQTNRPVVLLSNCASCRRRHDRRSSLSGVGVVLLPEFSGRPVRTLRNRIELETEPRQLGERAKEFETLGI